jgi:2-keto-3-deoxy-L-rhamnonate aldolase RhmA
LDAAELRRAVKRGELVLGTFVSECWSPTIARIYATAGFDFFLLDTEHGGMDMESVTANILVARGSGITPIVRIPWHDRAHVLRPLEAGAGGLLVPMVGRAHTLYKRVDPVEYTRQANEETTIAVQIETAKAIENLDAILSVEGVDVAYVGPSDLSHSLGRPGEITHPDVEGAIKEVIAACGRHGVTPGIHLQELDLVKYWVNQGMRFVSYASEVSFILRGATQFLTEVRSAFPTLVGGARN